MTIILIIRENFHPTSINHTPSRSSYHGGSHTFEKKVVGCKSGGHHAGQVRRSFFAHRHHAIDQITHFQVSCFAFLLSSQLNLLLPV